MTHCLRSAFRADVCASSMMRPNFWCTDAHDQFAAVRPPVIPPAFLLFLSCISPVISAQIPARMVKPARDPGMRGKNRKISTNELLKAEIIKQDQVLVKRAVSRFPRHNALCIERASTSQEPAQ